MCSYQAALKPTPEKVLSYPLREPLADAGILALLRNLKHSNEATSPPSRRLDHGSSQETPGSEADTASSLPASMSSSPLTPRGNSPLHRAGLPVVERHPPPRPSAVSEQHSSPGEGDVQSLSAGSHKARSRSFSYPKPKQRQDPQRPAPFPFSPASSPEQVVRQCPSLAFFCLDNSVACLWHLLPSSRNVNLFIQVRCGLLLLRRHVHGSMVWESRVRPRLGGCRAPTSAALTQHLGANRAMTPLRAPMSSAGSANKWCLQRNASQHHGIRTHVK